AVPLSCGALWTLHTMAVTACQGLGFVVSLIGMAGIIAATCMDQWSTQDLYNNPVTAVFNYQGLWRSCVRESSGFTECRGYFTLLGLPGKGLVEDARHARLRGYLGPHRGAPGQGGAIPPPESERKDRKLREQNFLELAGFMFGVRGARQAHTFRSGNSAAGSAGGPRAKAMSTTTYQVVGFLLSVLGLAGCIAATGMDMWSTQDLYDNPVTSVFQYEGLWRSCVRQSSGFTECRPYFTILGLPAMLQAVRALMIVGIVLGVIGLLVSIFALKCIRIGNMEDSAKANMTLTSGIMFIISGVCAIAGVSVFANMLVTNFWMSTANMYTGMGGMVQTVQTRYTFGSALFVGWVAGGLTLIGGVMMCIACRGLVPEETSYKAVSYHASGHNVGYKSGGFKASSGFGPNSQNKKIYNGSTRAEDEAQSPPSKYDYV
ncbi:Claudin-18, partial [Galemys pyrenaicus]